MELLRVIFIALNLLTYSQGKHDSLVTLVCGEGTRSWAEESSCSQFDVMLRWIVFFSIVLVCYLTPFIDNDK